MKIAVSGAGGFIGSSLVERLIALHHEIVPITRQDILGEKLYEKVNGCQCIVNLAGESIAGIWTAERKKKIRNSRVITARKLVEAVNRSDVAARKFISVSGVDIYDRIHRHDEYSSFHAEGFLGSMVREWEEALNGMENVSTHKIILRMGVVLGKSGGMFREIMRPFRFGLGVVIDSAEFLPFIHLHDLVRLFEEIILDDGFEGIYNVASPEMVTIHDFYTNLCREKGVLLRFKIKPALIVGIMGEAGSLLTQGREVVPKRLMDRGFTFNYVGIRDVLRDLLKD